MALNFDVAPYFDDFASVQGAQQKNYMRILFRAGQYAVQARELTQLQSILQNQISKLGDFVLKDGSPVHGGHVSVDSTVTAVVLNAQYNSSDISLSDFFVNGKNTLITNAAGTVTVKAFVVAIDDTQSNPIILVKYLTGTKFNAGDTIQVATGVQTKATIVSGSTAFYPASVASINEGIFYSAGFFVDVQSQTVLLSSSNSAPTFRIGLSIDETIVDETSDQSLLDPALGASNYQAPGATRYQYNLVLDKRTLDSFDDSAFYELLRLENGLVTSRVDYPILGDINNTLAERTYDQAGDFVVHPFISTVHQDNTNTSNFIVNLSPGKAYVKGYEFETIANKKINNPRALNTNTVNSYAISTEFGNILIVKNLFGGVNTGIFDMSQFKQVDLHCVPSANIYSANVAIYGATKIGTAKIRDLEYLGVGNYYAYVLDLNMSQNVSNIITGNANSVQLPVNFSNVTNAYINVTVTVNTGATFDTRTIVNYVSPNVVFFDRFLSVNATSTSNITFNYSIKDIESLVVSPAPSYATNVFYTQNTAGANYACMDISLAGKDSKGNTILSDTQFNKMIFPLPQNYIAQNTITNGSFYYRKNLWSQSFATVGGGFANLAITSGSGLGSGESFPYGFTNSYLTDAVANANFMIVVRNSQSSNLTNGQIITFNHGTVSAGNGIYQTDSTHLTAAVSSNAAFIGDIIMTVVVTNANSSAVARRTKTSNGNSSITTLRATDSYLNGTAVIGTANVNAVYVDTTNAFVWFPNYNDQALTPGANQSLYIPDVYRVTKIFSSGSSSYMPNVTNAVDVTNRYYLDSGQRDNYYDFSSLILKSGVNPPSGQTVAMVQFFSHDTVQGFFDADSYAANLYSTESIPFYSSPYFGTFSLRDSIDFRPTRQLGHLSNVQTFTVYGLRTPQPDHTLTLTYQFYLPRIDKLMLNKTGVFKMKQGIPSQYPIAPSDSDDSMTLYIISIPAYTANVSAISLQYVENKRYTMSDIGALDKRISQLEYYTALSVLEKQTTAEKILYQDNLTTKDQYGIIADDFGSFSIADNKSGDLRCYLQQGTLSPFKKATAMATNLVSATGNYQKNQKTITLPYTEVSAINQNTASNTVSVQPYLFAQFTGMVKLSPQTDFWFSANLSPKIISPPDQPVDLPVTQTATAAPALAPTAANAAPSAPTIVSGLTPISSANTTLAYFTGGDLVYVPLGTTNFGVISAVTNWYGNHLRVVNPVSQVVPINNIGTTLQLIGSTLSKPTYNFTAI